MPRLVLFESPWGRLKRYLSDRRLGKLLQQAAVEESYQSESWMKTGDATPDPKFLADVAAIVSQPDLVWSGPTNYTVYPATRAIPPSDRIADKWKEW